MNFIDRVKGLTRRLFLHVFDKEIDILVKYDDNSVFLSNYSEPRVYIQLVYYAPDTKNLSDIHEYKGRKWYLSEYMIDDEIVKTCYLAFRTCVEHEVLEGFKVDGVVLFNPHVDFEELLKISHLEVTRDKIKA